MRRSRRVDRAARESKGQLTDPNFAGRQTGMRTEIGDVHRAISKLLGLDLHIEIRAAIRFHRKRQGAVVAILRGAAFSGFLLAVAGKNCIEIKLDEIGRDPDIVRLA